MDQSSVTPPSGLVSAHPDNKDHTERTQADVNREMHGNNPDSSHTQANDERFSRVDERTARGHPTIDIAEVLRRWTHALQRIHKQSLQLAKVNDGEGPELLRSSHDGGTTGHTESLAATLAEHRQHLASIQVLINQLKEVAPAIQNSIMELTEEVNEISSSLLPMAKHHTLVQTQNNGSTTESRSDEVAEMTAKMSSMHFEKASASTAALKLPPLFSLTPNSSGKGGIMQNDRSQLKPAKQKICVRKILQICQFQIIQWIILHKVLFCLKCMSIIFSLESLLYIVCISADNDTSFVQDLKRSVRQAALSSQSYYSESSQDSRFDDSSEHYFIPVPGVGFSHLASKSNLMRSKNLLSSETDSSLFGNHAPQHHVGVKSDGVPDSIYDLQSLDDYDGSDGFLSTMGSSTSVSDACRSVYDMEEAQDQVLSPALLMDVSLLAESYEYLLVS